MSSAILGITLMPAAAVAATVPGPPLDVRGLSTDGQAEHVRVGWAPPADDGGALITAYAIQVSSDGLTWSNTRSPECEPTGCFDLTVTYSYELGIYQTYLFRAAAYNAAGWGPWSEPSPPYTVLPGNRPRVGAPSDLAAKAVLNGIRLTWSPPADDQGVSYAVEWSLDGRHWEGAWTRSTSYDISGLDYGFYDVRVRSQRWEVEYSAWAVAGPIRVPDRRQRIKDYVGLPCELDSPGITVIVPCDLMTNAGQRVRVRVEWTLVGSASGAGSQAVVVHRKACGKVRISLDGTPVKVTVTLSAPASGRFAALRKSRTYRTV